MLSLKKIVVAFAIAICIAIAGQLTLVVAAEAITINFQWTGQTGYFARGAFSYDEKTAPKIISEKGAGETKQLQSLVVTFYTPSGKPISTYEDVVNGVAQANYFEFNFNTVTQQLYGRIDIGGELSGETYLKGTVDRDLSLFTIKKTGSELILDADSGSLAAN
jgi:hypothetical protein